MPFNTQNPLPRITTCPLPKQGFQHMKQQPNCLSKIVEFRNDLQQSILPLNQLHLIEDASYGTTHHVVFITKWPWFLRDKHLARAAVFICPCAHGLVQADYPSRCELFHHVAIPCLQDLTNFPKTFHEGLPLLQCD